MLITVCLLLFLCFIFVKIFQKMELYLIALHIDNQTRIGVKPQFSTPSFHEKIRDIAGRRWCAAHRLWHIPYQKNAYATLKNAFSEHTFIKNATEQSSSKGENPNSTLPSTIPLPTVPVVPIEEEMLRIAEHPHLKHYLCIFLPKTLNNNYLNIIKNIHGRLWNADLLVWEVPYTRTTLRFVETYLAKSIVWNFEPKADIPTQLDAALVQGTKAKIGHKKEQPEVTAKHELAVTKLVEVLTLKRYSHRTVKAYKSTFRAFILYYDAIRP